MQKIEAILEIKTTAEAFAEYHKAKQIALAASKAAEAKWQAMGLPENGEGWRELAKLGEGETAKVVLKDGNGNFLASGTISQRTNPPRKASTFWVSPRL